VTVASGTLRGMTDQPSQPSRSILPVALPIIAAGLTLLAGACATIGAAVLWGPGGALLAFAAWCLYMAWAIDTA
jgi:hypothetical protein